ncbi:MAG: hypothetical protein A4S08_07635 [Proteobacteria bacterium SG_bin4]|nr:MAG: hypothetical protein A4S08_07635 [Proteobacteria bacterium SG_bin4]
MRFKLPGVAARNKPVGDFLLVGGRPYLTVDSGAGYLLSGGWIMYQYHFHDWILMLFYFFDSITLGVFE